MKRDSFTQALRATAKIACAASLLNVGCRSKTASQVAAPNTNDTAETEVSDTNEDTASNTDDTGSNTEDTGTEDTGSNTDDTASNTDETGTNTPTAEEEYAECLPLIEEVFANGDFPETDTISQEVKDCCALTAAYYDALAIESGDGMYDYTVIEGWEYRDQCCSALEWSDGSTACTPWGPPTPPSARKMKRRIVVRQHAVMA